MLLGTLANLSPVTRSPSAGASTLASSKTVPTRKSVTAFLAGLDSDQRKDCQSLGKIMRAATGKRAKMWGDSLVGFGSYHYKYASGREGNFFLAGYSPRKRNITVYVMDGFNSHGPLMKKLGAHKTGKSCLYLKRLSDVDLAVLEKLIHNSVEAMRKRYP